MSLFIRSWAMVADLSGGSWKASLTITKVCFSVNVTAGYSACFVDSCWLASVCLSRNITVNPCLFTTWWGLWRPTPSFRQVHWTWLVTSALLFVVVVVDVFFFVFLFSYLVLFYPLFSTFRMSAMFFTQMFNCQLFTSNSLRAFLTQMWKMHIGKGLGLF